MAAVPVRLAGRPDSSKRQVSQSAHLAIQPACWPAMQRFPLLPLRVVANGYNLPEIISILAILNFGLNNYSKVMNEYTIYFESLQPSKNDEENLKISVPQN